jgi:hypothetical protein
MPHVPTLHEVFSYLLGIGDLLASTLDSATGTILGQLGDVTKDKADSDAAELWFGAPGLVCRPALPTQGAASCQALHVKRSDHDICVAYRDLRANEVYANLAAGEGAFYATTGMARFVAKANGAVQSYTTDSNTKTGNAVWCGVSSYYQGTDGSPHLGGEWRYYAPWGGAWHDPSGYHLRTHHGVKIDAGGLSLPAPVSATVSTYNLKADSISLNGSSVKLGNGAALPVVLAPKLQVLMQTFSADLTAFSAAISAYATGIQGTADPTHAVTPALVTACTAISVSVNALMAGLALATGSTATSAT